MENLEGLVPLLSRKLQAVFYFGILLHATGRVVVRWAETNGVYGAFSALDINHVHPSVLAASLQSDTLLTTCIYTREDDLANTAGSLKTGQDKMKALLAQLDEGSSAFTLSPAWSVLACYFQVIQCGVEASSRIDKRVTVSVALGEEVKAAVDAAVRSAMMGGVPPQAWRPSIDRASLMEHVVVQKADGNETFGLSLQDAFHLFSCLGTVGTCKGKISVKPGSKPIGLKTFLALCFREQFVYCCLQFFPVAEQKNLDAKTIACTAVVVFNAIKPGNLKEGFEGGKQLCWANWQCIRQFLVS